MRTLREFRQAAGLSQERLAELIGSSQPTIQKLETGRMRLTVDYAARLGPALGIHPDELLRLNSPKPPGPAHAAGPAPTVSGPFHMGARYAAPADMPASAGQRALPVLSAARGGVDQEMFLEDGPIDWVVVPDSLKNARDPYGMYVVGESMMPRFRPQQLLYVNPHKPPAPGSGVVVVKKSKAVLVKEFVRRAPMGILVREYQPETREFVIPLEELEAVHTVVGLQEPS